MAVSSPSMGTLTASTFATTYDLTSRHSHSSITPRSLQITSEDDNDEIVWNISENSALVATCDEDFVVPRSDLSVEDEYTKSLETQMGSLSLGSKVSNKAAKKKAKKLKRSKNATPSQGTTPDLRRYSRNSAGPSLKRSQKQTDIVQVKAIEYLGFGQRPIVDDLSERLSVISGDKTPTMYEEASTYISSFLSNPHARTNDVCRLTLLQCLIIELGLATSSGLPSSLSAAKAFLKAHAFLNIREYIAIRGQGPEAVQSVMYPSRSALIKSIKKKKNPTSIKVVKELGLQVLLVEYMR